MPSELAMRWRNKAVASREEAERIRKTVGPCTDAEMRCKLRAEMWDACADELNKEIAPLLAENERLKDVVFKRVTPEFTGLVTENAALRQQVEFTNDWYAARWQRLRELIHEESPAIEDRAINVMANGSADTMESATRPSMVESLRQQVAELESTNRLLTTLRESEVKILKNQNAALRESIELCSGSCRQQHRGSNHGEIGKCMLF